MPNQSLVLKPTQNKDVFENPLNQDGSNSLINQPLSQTILIPKITLEAFNDILLHTDFAYQLI